MNSKQQHTRVGVKNGMGYKKMGEGFLGGSLDNAGARAYTNNSLNG